jgi:hypothetical protein
LGKRTAFRWAADHDDLDTASTIAHYAASSVSGANTTTSLLASAKAIYQALEGAHCSGSDPGGHIGS